MRLTLRTLLAYLDNTLEAQDAEALRAKLDESGFATQLVQRIRTSLASGELAAPSPDAVGPVEEANVISEYLDSTLPSEQVAEIERACLESDMHLAEAAACHQVLTMVLGESAEVSPELRQRIYELPQRELADIAVAGSFSSVAIPDQPQLGSLQDDIPTADPATAPGGKPVVPVGPEDSGVSDAPTRLRESGVVDGDDASEQAAIAGSRSGSSDNPYYGRSIRPSRITPWLVSLTLAGVLLFALTRIFQPLMDRYTADSGAGDDTVQLDPVASSSGDDRPLKNEIEVPADQSPLMTPVETPASDTSDADDDNASKDADRSDVDLLPAPTPDPAPESNLSDTAETPATPDSDSTATPAKSDTPTNPPTPPATDRSDGDDSPPADVSSADPPPADPPESVTVEQTPPEMKKDSEPPEPPKGEAIVAADNTEIAKLTTADTLLTGHSGDENWVWLKKDMLVGDGATLVCAPTFRATMSSEIGVDVTVVGATQLKWLRDDDGNTVLQVDYGRVLIASTKPTALQVRLGESTMDIEFPEVETVVAASLQHFRAPGFDPLVEENRIPVASLLTVQGIANLSHDGNQGPLGTGQQWYQRGKSAPQIGAVETLPDWIDEPDPAKPSLDSMARKDLLKLIDNDQALDLALRGAMVFRKTEVGALAAQTLLNLGRGNAYFGGDGVLSNAKQRAYWPDHYQALMVHVDRSAESASALNDAIAQMDSANGDTIFRLLTGFSQKQLIEGGDERLVRLLDSSSMAVRVLALENLRRITGTTLYFKADQDNAIRRAPDIKKWEVRKDKGDIRWKE